jgi:dihydroneopterin aldolase
VKERSVFIEGLKLHLKCGVYEEEKTLGVQTRVSVRVVSEGFVDYQELYNLIREVSRQVYTYIEDFQDALLERVIERWRPGKVFIRVEKLSVPFQHSFEGAGVELYWEAES